MPVRPFFSAVIFDLDGLVLDTESTYTLAWRHAAEAMGYGLSESFCQSLSGLHYQDVEAKLLAVCGADFDLQAFNQQAGACWRASANAFGIPVKPGVRELLRYLNGQGIPFALATNSRAANVRECLALSGLSGAFLRQVTRDDVVAGKPEPDVFLQAATLLKTPIRQCLVLEDSLTGIIAAQKAGAFSVLVPSVSPTDPQAAALCDLLLPDLHALLATIRSEFPYPHRNQV